MGKRGGHRPGAGTKKKSRHSRSYQIAIAAIEEGKAKGRLYPIEVMLDNMWDAYDKAMAHKKKAEKSVGKLKEKQLDLETINRQKAQDYAVDCAPFCHTKLGTLEVSGIDGEAIENKIVVEFVKSNQKDSAK